MDIVNNIKDFVNIDFIRGIVSAGLLGLISILWNKYKNYRKEKSRQFDYIWQPNKPLVNDYNDIKNIDEYKKDFAMIILSNGIDIDPNKTVDELDAFKQHLIKLVNTENDKYRIYQGTNYGVSYILVNAKNSDEFKSMANIVGKEIIENMKEWIKEMHSIKKVKDKNKIIIELGLRGIHEIVEINIPIFQGNNEVSH